jgi:hypothetical protein
MTRDVFCLSRIRICSILGIRNTVRSYGIHSLISAMWPGCELGLQGDQRCHHQLLWHQRTQVQPHQLELLIWTFEGKAELRFCEGSTIMVDYRIKYVFGYGRRFFFYMLFCWNLVKFSCDILFAKRFFRRKMWKTVQLQTHNSEG